MMRHSDHKIISPLLIDEEFLFRSYIANYIVMMEIKIYIPTWKASVVIGAIGYR